MKIDITAQITSPVASKRMAGANYIWVL